MKKRVLLLLGGQSEEHEVSVSSARGVLKALPEDRFEVTPMVVSKEGRWLPLPESRRALEMGAAKSDEHGTGGELALRGAAQAGEYDVVFPLLHGPMGEDGTVQGLLTLAGIPFVGSGVLGSALCMDKVMSKQVLASCGVPQVAWRLATRREWRDAPEQVRSRAAELGFPLFVKPANLGSSVGVSKVRAADELTGALDLAFSLDRRAILEAAAPGGQVPGGQVPGNRPRELEVGVLGNDAPLSSPVGELTYGGEFYDYRAKYTEGEAKLHIPARLPLEVSERARDLALTAFRALDCAGLARVDFFYVPASEQFGGELYLNEVNTMPGFTPTSMYPKLWEAAGLSYAELVTRLIELATEAR